MGIHNPDVDANVRLSELSEPWIESAEGCSQPDVIVFLDIATDVIKYYDENDGRDDPEEQIVTDLNEQVMNQLRDQSSGIVLRSGHAIWGV